MSSEEERADDEHDDQRPADERVVEAARGTCARRRDHVAGEDERPQQDRALEADHSDGEVEQRWRRPPADLLDVREPEVTRDQGALHPAKASTVPASTTHAVAGTDGDEAGSPSTQPGQHSDDAEQRGPEADGDAGYAERSIHDGLRRVGGDTAGILLGGTPRPCFTSRSVAREDVAARRRRACLRPPPGSPRWNSCGGEPGVVAHGSSCRSTSTSKSTPSAVFFDRAFDDGAAEAEALVAAAL